MKKNQKPKLWRILIPLLAAAVLVGGGVFYYFWNQSKVEAVQAQSTSSAAKTTQAKLGDITISISGTGTLVSGKETSLSFSASGKVAELNVQVGDVVAEGAVLAKLSPEDIVELQAEVEAAQEELESAEQAVSDLQSNAAANLANAQLTLTTAKKALTDAQSGLIQPSFSRCDQESIDIYYEKYLMAVKELEHLQEVGEGNDYYLNTIVPQKNKVTQAYNTYIWCNQYTEYEIDSSVATLALAQADVITAQDKLDTLQTNNGIDPTELAKAENQVANAKIALENVQKIMDGATITAPYAGTILSVGGSVGDPVGTSTFITIADLAHPRVSFIIDETDLSALALDQEAEITFDAIEDRVFSGSVTRIDPTLTTVSGYQAVQGMIDMDLSKETDLPTMPTGLQASVEIYSAKAVGVVLVPTEALRDLGDGTYSVFVLDQNGEMAMRVVEIGLEDATYVEITAGLQAGETVSTGITEVE